MEYNDPQGYGGQGGYNDSSQFFDQGGMDQQYVND